jgi:cold shock CspA family protein
MKGEISFYDEPGAWGLVMGEDGRFYVVRGSQMPGVLPRVGERVDFEPVTTAFGLRAAAVRRVA